MTLAVLDWKPFPLSPAWMCSLIAAHIYLELSWYFVTNGRQTNGVKMFCSECLCGRDRSHIEEIKIIHILTKPRHTVRRTTASRAAPTITARLGLAGSTLASRHRTNTFIKAAVNSAGFVQTFTHLENFSCCPRLTVVLIFRQLTTNQPRLIYFPYQSSERFTSSKVEIVYPVETCLMVLNRPYESCGFEPTSANKPRLLVCFRP